MSAALPEPGAAAGREGLAALVSAPDRALIALDYDGTLAPIVPDPSAARAHPRAEPALRRLAAVAGTVAVITGRPAAAAVELGGFGAVAGLVVLGHYGFERWQDGRLSTPPSPPEVAEARNRLPGVLARAGAPAGTWVEDKGHALAVHTRRAADPAGTLRLLEGPLAALAAATGLAVEPGRLVIELRPRGTDKGSALAALVAERAPDAVLVAGDDLGDLAAFAQVRAMRQAGRRGLLVCSGSAEVTELAAQADLVVDGPDGVVALLEALAAAMGG